MSSRILNQQYMIISSSAHRLAATLSLVYLVYCEKENSNTAFQERNSLYDYAVRYWYQHYRDSETDEKPRAIKIVDLCRRFLQSSVVALGASVYSLVPGPVAFRNITSSLHRRTGSLDEGIYFAAIFGINDVIDLFLQRGANIDFEFIKEDLSLGNPLTAAVEGDHPSTVEFLLDRGADVYASDRLAGRWLGLKPSTSNSEGLCNLLILVIRTCPSDSVVQCLLDNGADANSHPRGIRSPLQEAAVFNKEYIVRLLLDKGAEINQKGSYHGNALQAAICAPGWDGLGMIRFLLERGANMHLRGRHGTALQAAVCIGKSRVVKLLLEHKANPFERGGKFGSPLEAAIELKSVDVLEILLNHRPIHDSEAGILMRALDKAKSWSSDVRDRERIVRILEEKFSAGF
jgi:ankyrin repeat protein